MVLRTLAVGQREWIRSCLASLQISLETDENGGTSIGYFVTGLVSSTDTAEEWLDQAANSPVELGEAVPDRRETDKALYMSLEALDLVKTVTHKRGFESWRKLNKEHGTTTGTSLHECTNLLEFDFGTTDGFENQIVDFQKCSVTD